MTASLFMLRCHELGLSCEDQSQYTIGMVNDMLTEKSNDSAKYPLKATQSDIDKFLGR